jgi:hypothetical protein
MIYFNIRRKGRTACILEKADGGEECLKNASVLY